MEGLAQDARHALRLIAKAPSFTAAVVLVLTLGIGANTAVFSVLDGVVLKSLPVREPDELVTLRHPSFSYPIFQQVKARGGAIFSDVFAWDDRRELHAVWNEGGEAEDVEVLVASGEFHPALGARAAVGRLFAPEDDQAAASPVAVLSHAAWQRRFAADPAVIGRSIRIEGLPFTIVGVTTAEFFGVSPGIAPEITIPLATVPRLKPRDETILERPTTAWLKIMARLKPGVSLQQAQSAFAVIWPQVLEAATPRDLPDDRRARYLTRKTGLLSARTGHSSVRNQFAQPLWLLLALVGLLLLVACATAGNLFLARASVRRREVAVRIALGASRGRVVRQLLVEGLALAVIGGACGLLVAAWGSQALVGMLSTRQEPVALDVGPDARVLAFTLGVAFLSCLAFALAPALRATRVDPGPALQQGSRVLGRHRSRLARSLVVWQVSVSVILLGGTALFARSLSRLLAQDTGLRPKNVLLLSTDPAVTGHRDAARVEFYRQLLERLASVPAVESASLSYFPPISDESGSWTEAVSVDGAPVADLPHQSRDATFFNAVSPGYFATVGTPLLRGRDFGPQDTPSGPRTAIVNEAFARAYFPGQDPIGRLIGVGRDPSRQGLLIVGIVRDAKYQNLQEPTRRIAYLPYLQLAELWKGAPLVAAVRTAIAPRAMVETLRKEVRGIDRVVPLRFETLSDRIRESLATERVLAIVSAVLGGVALLLASAGLYGLMAYTVSRRTSEIGVRMALGARRGAVLWLILRQSLILAAGGVVLGLAGSLALGRFVRSLLHGLTPSDPIALGAAGFLMLSVAALAGYLPARRASRVDPVVALRQE